HRRKTMRRTDGGCARPYGDVAGSHRPGLLVFSRAVAEPLQIWFEFGSTYSYPGVFRAPRLAAQARGPLAWKPFLLGPIFRAQGWDDSPFNIYPVKGRYMWRDLERICAACEIPLRRPSVFPRSSLLAARVACAGAGEPWAGDFIRGIYHAN